MKMMVEFSMPTDSGNDIVRSGKVAKIFENLMADLKPEATYFYPTGGGRGGHMIVEMTDSSDVANVGERFWFGLKAHVTMRPVMGPGDLQKGLAGMEDTIKRFG
jgi:hypothetical protein